MDDQVQIICMAHGLSDLIIQRYRSLSRVSNTSTVLYVDQSRCGSASVPADVTIKTFDFDDFARAGYRPIYKGVVPGSNHFPVVEQAADSGERFAWCVEYDAVFNGEWQTFFDAHADTEADLLTTNVRSRSEDPRWHWWRSLKPPEALVEGLSDIAFIRSFNPVYRLSRQAAIFLRNEFKTGWVGHHEVSMATLLLRGGFSVEDFGGAGTFVRPKNYGKWYQSKTFNHRRTMLAPTDGAARDMLFHPMKSEGCIDHANLPSS